MRIDASLKLWEMQEKLKARAQHQLLVQISRRKWPSDFCFVHRPTGGKHTPPTQLTGFSQ